jgi:hypothetical protein
MRSQKWCYGLIQHFFYECLVIDQMVMATAAFALHTVCHPKQK